MKTVMKTTIEIPEPLFRQAKTAAAEQGVSFRVLLTEALTEKLARRGDERPWMKSFGKLRSLRPESARLNRVIEQEFGRIDPEEWR